MSILPSVVWRSKSKNIVFEGDKTRFLYKDIDELVIKSVSDNFKVGPEIITFWYKNNY